jgi:transcriptional regulator with XRE-family HTH domain
LSALSERDRESVSLFVDEMKADRTQRKWPQAELARQAHCSESSIAMVESYQRPPTASLAKALDKAFGTSGTYARMERRLRNLPFPASFRSFAPHEAEAATLSMFEHSLIPGLLQTPEYARAVLETKPNTTVDEIDNLVSGRVTRQSVLGRDDPPAPLMYALVDEGALNRPVAPPAVMHDQLAHLVDLSRKPNVTIQVVPYDAGGHSGLLGRSSSLTAPAQRVSCSSRTLQAGASPRTRLPSRRSCCASMPFVVRRCPRVPHGP